jgi:ABC-type Fe3+-siderophore transport system permease subunit
MYKLWQQIIAIPKMKISILDDPVAIGLGLHVQRMKLIQLITSTIDTSIVEVINWISFIRCTCKPKPIATGSSSIDIVGNIGFVGLIAPHIAKTIVRGSYAKKLLMSAMIGMLPTKLIAIDTSIVEVINWISFIRCTCKPKPIATGSSRKSLRCYV